MQTLTIDPTEEGGRNQASTYIYIHLEMKTKFEFYSLRLRDNMHEITTCDNMHEKRKKNC